MRRALIALGAVALVVAAGLAIFVAAFDAGRFKPRIEAAARRATGRELAINGALSLSLFPPGLIARDVTLANVPGGSRPEMARMARIEAYLSPRPLLRRRVEISQLVLAAPDILLERGAAGRPNWVFEREAAPAAPVSAASGSPRWTAGVDAVTIEGGAFAFGAERVDVQRLSLKIRGPSIDIAGQASRSGAPFTIAGTLGLPSDAPGSPVDIVAGAAGASLSVKGSAGRDAEMLLVAAIPDLSALSPLLGASLPALRDIAFHARLAQAEQAVVLRDMSLVSPQADIAGNVTIGLARPSITGAASASRLDLDAVLAAIKAAPRAAPPGAGAPGASAAPPAPLAKNRRVIPDTRLPFDRLRGADADLTLTIASMRTGGADYRNIAGHLVLHDGKLALDPFSGDLPAGHMTATLRVDASQAVPPVALSVHAPQLAAQPMAALFGLQPAMVGEMDVDIDLAGAGQTPREIAAVADGHVGLALVNGSLDRSALMEGGLGQVLREANVLNAGGERGPLAVRCLALRADAVRGLASLKALSLDTDQLALDGSGTINLADETLDLRLRPLVRLRGTGIAVPLDVGGTLGAPRARVDAARGAGEAGKIPFGIVIGALGDASETGDPCAAALSVARGGAPGPAPASPPVRKVEKLKPADILRQLLR